MQGLCSNMHFTKQGMINLLFWTLITRNPTYYIKFINLGGAIYMCLGDASFNHIFFQCLTGVSNYAFIKGLLPHLIEAMNVDTRQHVVSPWWSSYTLQAPCSWIVDSHMSWEMNWYPGQHIPHISVPLTTLHGNIYPLVPELNAL